MKNWYTLQVHATFELSAKSSIEKLIKDNGWENRITEMLLPTDNVIYTQNKKTGPVEIVKEKAIYPGYIFIEIEDLDVNIQSSLTKLPKVSTFIGTKEKPTILLEEDIDKIRKKSMTKNTRYNLKFEKGDKVRIIEGSFSNFVGEVISHIPETQTVRINISIFGRDTETEVDQRIVKKEL